MKKLLFTLVLSLVLAGISQTAKAQLVVEDPAMLTATISNWTAQLDRALEQYNEMKGQTQIMREQIERFKKVNETIKNSVQVKNLLEKQVNLIGMISKEVSNAGKEVLNPDAYKSYMRRLNSYAAASQNNVAMMRTILSDESMKLSDYERLQMIESLDEKTNGLIENVTAETKQYQNLNRSLRELKRLMN